MFQKERNKAINAMVPEGWKNIVVKLDEDLAKIIPNYTIFQIKEKFGGLRFYIDFPLNTDEDTRVLVYQKINEAEWEAEKTCQNCGEPGELRNGSWLLTLCDECI